MSGLPFPNIDPIAFEIGPLIIRWYALAYIAGILLGWRYCMHLARQSDDRPTAADIDDFMIWAVIGIVLGGRIGYVSFYKPGYFLLNPVDALKVWEGGMSFHGGLIGVLIAIAIFSYRRGISVLAFSDLIAVVAPIGLFFGRIANFVNGELFGRVTDVPWAVVFPHGGDLPRHPSQIYEAVLEGLLLFVLLAMLARRPGIRARTGFLSGLFLVGYGSSRAFVELFREPDAHLGFVFGPITMGQILSVPMVVFGLYLVVRARDRRSPKERLTHAE